MDWAGVTRVVDTAVVDIVIDVVKLERRVALMKLVDYGCEQLEREMINKVALDEQDREVVQNNIRWVTRRGQEAKAMVKAVYQIDLSEVEWLKEPQEVVLIDGDAKAGE